MSAGVCACCRREGAWGVDGERRCAECRAHCRPGEHFDGQEFVRMSAPVRQLSLPFAVERASTLHERLGMEP